MGPMQLFLSRKKEILIPLLCIGIAAWIFVPSFRSSFSSIDSQLSGQLSSLRDCHRDADSRATCADDEYCTRISPHDSTDILDVIARGIQVYLIDGKHNYRDEPRRGCNSHNSDHCACEVVTCEENNQCGGICPDQPFRPPEVTIQCRTLEAEWGGPTGGTSNVCQCMPDHCKKTNTIDAYRNYYLTEKASISTWKYSNQPAWWTL